jgi:transposase
MNQYRKELAAQGLDAMPVEGIREYEEKYFSILKQGREENKATSHKYAKQDEAGTSRQDGKIQPQPSFISA